MVAHVATVAFLGLEARAVEVQVQIASGVKTQKWMSRRNTGRP